MPKVLKLVLGGMLLTQTVFAQPAPAPAPGPAPAPTTGTGPAPGAPAPGTETAAPPPAIDLSVRQRSTLSPQEMVSQSRQYREQAATVLKRIEGRQEQAKKDKDIIRLNCLTDKKVQAEVNLKIADQAIVNLEDAIRRTDEGASLHEFTRVTLVQQKAQVLDAEAEQCVGEDLTFVGATRVDVETDPNLRKDDPTSPSTFGTQQLDRPPVASPFR